MISQEHFIGYVTTTLNNTFTNNLKQTARHKLPGKNRKGGTNALSISAYITSVYEISQCRNSRKYYNCLIVQNAATVFVSYNLINGMFVN